ncbi:hypothetical protein M3Y99_00471300 [Aphelenchoides fujianensis]|nr:hypothetical protein M3Y99_00471300 [Aphelenchoides fujianensis]
MASDFCWCGVHVHKGTLVLAILCLIGVILAILGDVYLIGRNDITTGETLDYVLFSVRSRAFYHAIWDILLNTIVAIACLMLIYGNRRRKPSFYIPFLIIGYFELGFQIAKVPGKVAEIPEEERSPTFFGILAAIGIAIIIFMIDCYFLFVVIRGRRYLLNARAGRHNVLYTTRGPQVVHPTDTTPVQVLTKSF